MLKTNKVKKIKTVNDRKQSRKMRLSNQKKRLKGQKLVTHVVFVLDHSGSMGSVATVAKNNFNEQLQTIKNINGQTVYVSLIEFSNRPEIVFANKDCKDVKEITDYRCNGSTALYDAVGMAVNELKKISALKDTRKTRDELHSALVITITDGKENASTEYGGSEGQARLKKELEVLDKTGNFTFTFMGGNLDTVGDFQNSFGLNSGNTIVFDTATISGQSAANFTINTALNNYFDMRTMGFTSSNVFYSSTTGDTNEEK